MADVKTAYSTKATIVCTLTSLANAAARESTFIENEVNLYLDALVRIKTNGLAGSTLLVDIYVYASLDDTDYTDGATGTDAGFTAANRRNAKYLASVQLAGATQVKAFLGSIAQVFGGVLPRRWGLIVINNSGAALSATAGDHVIEYEGVYATVT
jgi:hypothetical protein